MHVREEDTGEMWMETEQRVQIREETEAGALYIRFISKYICA